MFSDAQDLARQVGFERDRQRARERRLNRVERRDRRCGRATPVFSLLVALLLELLMLRVEEALADERDRSEERHRIAAAAAAALPSASETCSATGVRTTCRPAPRIGHGADLRLVEPAPTTLTSAL